MRKGCASGRGSADIPAHIHGENPFEQFGPGVTAFMSCGISGGRRDRLFKFRFRLGQVRGGCGRDGNDQFTPFGTGSENAGIANQIETWRRNQGRQAGDQFLRGEQDLIIAVVPYFFEMVAEIAVGQRFKAFGGDRRAGGVTAKLFEARTVSRRNPGGGLKIDAVNRGTKGGMGAIPNLRKRSGEPGVFCR